MIIDCPCGEKKFEVDQSLIPEQGRLLKCGACDKTWFFEINNQKTVDKSKPEVTNNVEEFVEKVDLVKERSVEQKDNSNVTHLVKEKNTDNLTKKKSSDIKLTKILSYIIVVVISSIALILVLETFKSPISILFPKLEFLLFSFFETLKDIFSFIKNLVS
tara:strand:+ start:20 stop:499 length:480 start_codon:yes stop_codon:yes gene_type:complete